MYLWCTEVEYNLWFKKKKWKYHAREKKKIPSLSLPLLCLSVSPQRPSSLWYNLPELCKSPPVEQIVDNSGRNVDALLLHTIISVFIMI